MKYARILAVAIVAFALATPAGAKTLVWNTSVTTSDKSRAMLSDKANWLENGSPATTGPEPGDRLEIGGSAYVYFDAETFDIGSAGLTIYNTKKFYINTVFTGSGVLTFDGTSTERVFQSETSSSHTGGTVIKSSLTKFNKRYINPLGTGPVDIHQASETRPRLENSTADLLELDNVFVLHGKDSIKDWTPFDTAMPFQLNSISSDHDFTINCSDRCFYVTNGISAPGKTVTFNVRCTTSSSSHKNTDIRGAIDANVVVKAYTEDAANRSMVRFYGQSTVASNTLTVVSGTNMLTSASHWAGTNITIGATATLSLKGAGNLSPSAHLAVAEGGTVEVASGVTVQIATLSVGETDLLPGIYTASTLPGTVSGSGALLVLGDNPFVWKGADPDNPTQWSVEANWQGNEVPGDGAVVYFPASTVVSSAASAVDVGASGLTLVINGTVDFRDPLSGSGALTVTGNGRLNLDDAATYSGGTTISGSAIVALYATGANANPLGSGVVTIDGSKGGIPGIRIAKWGVTLPNDCVVYGAITNKNSQSGYGCIDNGQSVTISGNMTGDDDILLYSHQGSETVSGNITVPAGKTIRLITKHDGSVAVRRFAANGTLNGNLSVEGTWKVKLGENATCTGDVTVRNTATLELTAAGNLAETAVVSIPDGGKIDIASGVKVKVAELWVGGGEWPHGKYTKNNCPNITGDGTLVVGDGHGFTLIVY